MEHPSQVRADAIALRRVAPPFARSKLAAMDAEPERLRAALAAFLAEEARGRVERWRADPHADTPGAIIGRHTFLGTRGAAELLAELSDRGRVTSASAGALAAHLRRFTREQKYASVRRTLRALEVRPLEVQGRTLPFRTAAAELWGAGTFEARRARMDAIERVARAAAPVLRERRIEAEEAASARRLAAFEAPDAGRGARELAKVARGVLDGTADLLGEGLDWLAHRMREPAREAFDLLVALRAPDLDDAFPAEGRFRRLGELAGDLGVHRELSARVRVDANHGSADPRPRLALVRPPHDVRVAPSHLELGAVSELGAAYATGRALAACLAHRELPVELRWPVEGTMGRAVGSLFAQWAFDDERLARARRAPPAVLDHARRLAAFVAAVSLRVAAVVVLLGPEPGMEEAAYAARRALGLPCAPEVASVLLFPHGGASARLRGELGGLALWSTLRDRFDADWYRNPRARDVFRGAAERGAGLSIEALEDELGVGSGAGLARVLEWFRGG